jgi:hypothetical protein
MSNALEQAQRAVLRAIRNKDAPPDDGGPYIWVFRDEGGPFWGGVFNPTRFALDDPDGFADWVMGRQNPERPLNPPHPDDLEAVKLLPARLQRKIRNYEKGKNATETQEASAEETADEISEP